MKSTNILFFHPLLFVSQWLQEYFRRIPLSSFLNTDSTAYAYNRLLPVAYWNPEVPKAFRLYHPCYSRKEKHFIAIDLIATGRRTLLRAYSHNDDALFDWFMSELRRSWPENELWCAECMTSGDGPDAGDIPVQPVPSKGRAKGGNPGLSRAELVKRLAMAMRAEFIKDHAIVPTTWEDIVVTIKWPYGSRKDSQVRLLSKACKKLKELRQEGDPCGLLAEAEQQYQELYQPRKETNSTS